MKMISFISKGSNNVSFTYTIKKEEENMKDKIRNRKKLLLVIIIITVLAILFLSGFSLGKAYSKTDIQGISKIAEPILDVENGSKIQINNKNTEGNYEFKVKNFKQDDNRTILTDVGMNYYIEVLNTPHEAIELELYRGDEKIDLVQNKTKTFFMSKDIEQEDSYIMKIKYNKNLNKSMSDIMQELQIKVHAEQEKA